jgi:oxamate amidohydrolase
MTHNFAKAAVAAPHDLAVRTGQAILMEGGNAVEAMVAMAATIAVVYPHMNGLGGDGFWLIREPDGKVHAIEACGFAGEKATIAAYRAKGYASIPARGPDAALTVAGTLGGWLCALDLAGARLPLDLLLCDAISFAKNGYETSASQARTIPKLRDKILEAPGFHEYFWQNDAPPERGSLRKAPTLGACLDHLARAGLDDFYRGDVAREMAADLEAIGSPVTRSDLARYQARKVMPLTARLNDMTLYNCPPPTQGLASLLLLGIFEATSIKAAETPECHHILIEAVKRAFTLRDRLVTDPDHLPEDPQVRLTQESFLHEAARIDSGKAGPYPAPHAMEGDTIWMGAIDAEGRTVSFIQSIYWEYGSGCVSPKTGIHWQNRGAAFSLDPAHFQALIPGRKPFHTLNPPLAVFDDGRIMSYGTMGGEGQPQFQAQIFLRAARMGLSPFAAIDAPRWLYGRNWGDPSASLKIEPRFDPALISDLKAFGHDVEIVEDPYSDTLGHAGMLVRDSSSGSIEAAHDPRSDGGAAGL